MVSNIVQLPKRPTGQLRGNLQGKTGPAAMILQFLQLQHLADHYKKTGFPPECRIPIISSAQPRNLISSLKSDFWPRV